MIFNTDEKAEAPLNAVPTPTEQRMPQAPLQESSLFEPSPPTNQRKAAVQKPPKPVPHKFNPSASRRSSTVEQQQPQAQRRPAPTTNCIITPVEQLFQRVQLLASDGLEPGEKPNLHQQLKTLDSVLLGEDPLTVVPPTAVANAVYRLLIKREKQIAYQSLVSIQSEIYDLQDQETGILSRSFEKEAAQTITLQDRSIFKADSQNFTFAPKESVSCSGSITGGRLSRKPIGLNAPENDEAEETSAQRRKIARNSNNINYMSDSELKKQRSSEKFSKTGELKLQGRCLPPKMIKKQESLTSLAVSQKLNTALDLTNMSQQDHATQMSSHRSISIFNGQSTSGLNMPILSSQLSTRNAPITNQNNVDPRIMQMPVQMSVRSRSYGNLVSPPQFKEQSKASARQPLVLSPTAKTFHIIEEVIGLQKSRGFSRRCEKLIKLQRQQKLGHHENQHSFGGSTLNCDLETVKSTKSVRKLPRFSFNQNIIEDVKSTSSSDEKGHQEKAVDSNKAIMRAYYVKKLLQKSLRVLENFPKEVKAKRDLQAMAADRHEKLVQRIALNRLKKYLKRHQGHFKAKILSQAFFKARVGRVYLRHWQNRAIERQANWEKLILTSKAMRQNKQRCILKSWRNAVLRLKVNTVQMKTAAHIYAQRAQAKAYGALVSFARYSIRTRFYDNKCYIANKQRLEFKAFSAWKCFLMLQAQKMDLGGLADSLRRICLQRQALFQLKQFIMMREHQNNLKRCAKEFHAICLQRIALRNWLLFRVQQREQLIRKASIRQFYEANLKAKLFSFLHQSNIEFIQYFVRVEDFLQRRRKMRDVLRVLYKNAKIEKATSSFIRFPEPKALYCAFLWLSSKRQKKFSFSSIKTLKHHPAVKFIEKRKNADVLLHNYVTSKVFRAWSKQTKRVRTLRERIRGKILRSVVDAWYLRSRVDATRKKKLKYMRNKIEMKQKIRLFRGLRLNKFSNMRLKKLQKTVARKHLTSTLMQNFRVWFSQFAAIEDKRTIKYKSAALKRRLNFRRFFGKWRKEFGHIQLKRSLEKRRNHFQTDVTKRKFLTRWRIAFKNQKSLTSKGLFVRHGKQRDIVARAWYALRKYKDVKKRAALISYAMEESYRQKVLTKCIAAWKRELPSMKMKRQLRDEVTKDYSLRLKVKVLKAFVLNSKYSKTRKDSDELMTKAVQEIGMRKFFRYWRSLAAKRMGLLIFEQTFEKLRVASFFKRASRKVYFEEETQSHMNLLRDYQNLQKTFGALRLHRQRRDLDNAKIASIQNIRDILCSGRFFKIWRQKFAVQVTEKSVTRYAVSHIEGSMLRRCFDAIKANFVESMKGRIVRIKHMERIRKNAFDNLRKNAMMKHAAGEMVNNREMASRQSFFNFWMLEMREKRMIKGLVVNHMCSLAAKAIHALRHNARIQNHRKFLLEQGQALNSFNLVKKVFFLLSTHANNQSHNRQAIVQIQQLQQVNRRRQALRTLYQAMINSKIVSLVYEQVSLRTNRRLASDYLGKMRKTARPRILQFEACRMLHMNQQKIALKLGLKNWYNQVQFIRQVELITQQFDVYKRTQTLRKVFKSLKITTKAKRAKRCLLDALLQKSVLVRKQRLLHGMRSTLKSKQSTLLNNHVARTYREDRLRRMSLSILHVNSLNNRRLKCIYGTTVFQRLIPKAFACLQMHRGVQRVKRIMLVKANGMHALQLQRRSLASLIHHVNRRRKASSKNKVASTFARMSLRKRAFKILVAGMEAIRELKGKRERLYDVVHSWSNDVTQKNMFKAFKNAVECSKLEESDVGAKMLRGKKMRSFQAWHGFQMYNKQIFQASETVKGNRGYFKMKDSFAKLVRAFSNEVKIKLQHRNRETKLMSNGFQSFRLAKNLQKAALYAGMWHQEYLKRAFFNAVFAQIGTKEVHAEKVTQMESVNDVRLKTRVILAFKYFLICQNSQKMIKQKLDKTILEKAFGALKYENVSQRIVRNYIKFQHSKTRKNIFARWQHRFTEINSQKAKIGPILARLNKATKLDSFKQWQKNVFRDRLVLLLHESLVVPTQIDLVRRCLQGWRKHTKFSKNKDFYTNEIGILRDFNTRRHIFESWFNSAMQRAPISLFCAKMEKVKQSMQLRRAFHTVLDSAVKDEQLEGLFGVIQKQSSLKVKAKFISLLKQKVQTNKKALEVQQKNQNILLNKIFLKWLEAHDKSVDMKEQDQIEKLALEQAAQFYDLKVAKRCLNKLFSSVIDAKKYKQARLYYQQQLQRRIFDRFVAYAEHKRSQGSSNRLIQQFKKTRARSFLKDCLVTWQRHVSQKGQARQIIRCFKDYSSIRLLGQAFNEIRQWGEERRQTRTKHQQISSLIKRRQRLRVKVETFAFMLNLARKQRQERQKEQIAIEEAENFYTEKLTARVFDAWNGLRFKESESQRRSRMYNIFSAWKFYSKERSLLKRYLFECGESIDNVSQMTTMELRGVAEQRKDASRLDRSNISGTDSQLGGSRQNDRSRLQPLMSSISHVNSSMNEQEHSTSVINNIPSSVGLVLSKFSNNSRVANPSPALVPTPSFVRESLPEGSLHRARHISPDIVFQEAVKRSKVEGARSAELTSSRKRSSTVVSLLQKQFGGEQK